MSVAFSLPRAGHSTVLQLKVGGREMEERGKMYKDGREREGRCTGVEENQGLREKGTKDGEEV